MEKPPLESNGLTKKGSLKKQLSFDEKVTEFRVMARENKYNLRETDQPHKGIKWWTPSDKSIAASFCKDTSIHGLKYLGNEGVHFGERILWGVVFLVSALTAVWLIKAVFVRYFDSPVVVTFQSSEMFIGDLPYPAVTICNMNRVLKSKADEIIRTASSTDDNDENVQKARHDAYYLDHVCSVSNKPFSNLFNYTIRRGSVDPSIVQKINLTKEEEDVEDVLQFLQRAAQPCKNMIQLCMWEGDAFKCTNHFRPIETNFGRCCTFNMVPNTLLHTYLDDNRDTKERLEYWKTNDGNMDSLFESDDAKRPRHQRRAGKASGLMFLADPDLDEYFCTSSDSTGFRLSVHFSYDIPHVTDFGLAIRPNYEHFVSVTPNVIRADDVIRSYSVEKRNCYFHGEYTLKYYNYYSASNCLDECVANITHDSCNCVRYYMPRDDSRDICTPAKFSCAEDVRKKLFKSGVKNMCQKCLPTCTEIRYSASATLAPLRSHNLWVDENNKTAPWARKNISIIHVYFGEDSTYPKVRSQLYGITDLIANTGGLLGLCMGFSLLSLVEFIYYFTFRMWNKKQFDRMNDCEPSPAPDATNGHHLKIGSIVDKKETRMKPGDDGKYHLQVCRSPSNGSVSSTDRKDSNGKIPETVAEEDVNEDIRL